MADLIDREKALACFWNYANYDGTGYDETDMPAYDRLQALPSAQPQHEVRFSDVDHVWIDGKQYISLQRFGEAVKEAQPQRTGRWLKISPAGIYECSECGKNVMTADIDAYDFCHGCGAKMEVEHE